ncbi:MAG TPA: adenylate/guanylate cyclase domain-containing protein [Actinomycetota bacterium]|nr:adenylate/guanylate cyclase domain-containing protein [Actinomycetota bacterium]
MERAPGDGQIRYAKSGDVNIAWMAIGDADVDIVQVPGFVSHLEIGGELPQLRHIGERLLSFARLTFFDKRGTGLSDPVAAVPTLEERMDDIRAVMDASGVERAVLFGASEGVPLSILFAATYPQRVSALVLYGGMARTTYSEDHPWAPEKDALLEANELLLPFWGQGIMPEMFAPSVADDPEITKWSARLERYAASPAMVQKMFEMFYDTDVRAFLPLVNVPTLILHRTGDRIVNIRSGRYLAEHIPGARLVEMPGSDHAGWSGDTDAMIDEVQEFLTGVRGEPDIDRVLATVMFTDIVDSTRRAAEVGDRRWHELLDEHDRIVARHVEQFRGRYIKHTGDGFLATFDGPGRAIQCARALNVAIGKLGIEIRAGLHAGEVELRGEDVGGIAVHIAARVCARAGAREILVSSTVKDLVVGSGTKFDERGEHELKGVPDRWRLFAVVP